MGDEIVMSKIVGNWKSIFIALIMILNVFSSFFSSLVVNAEEVSVRYQAFTNGGYRHSSNNYDVYSGALFLRELGSKDTGQNSITAFCFNAGRTMPPEITVLDAGFDSVIVNTKYDRESNVSSLYEYSDNPALNNKEEFNKKIKQILYNGYPINGSNFNSGTDSISLSAFRRATQKAIWAYTDGGVDMNIDNIVNHFQFPQNEKNMLRRLLEATNDVPNNFVVDFYRADTQGMQNIVTGRIDPSTPEVPKEKDVVISKVNLGGEEIAGAKIQINQGNKEIASWTSEAGKNHELSLLPGDYVFHEEAAPKGYVVVTDITFTVNTDGTVTVKDANGNKVVAANNQLTVTDETEYVNPTGTLRTTVKADSTIANATKAAEVTAEKAATGVEVTDTLTYEGLVPEKVYSVTGELYEVKDGQVVGTAKATATKEFTVSKEGKGEWQLAFGQVTGLEAGKTYVVYETATSKDNLVDTNKDNTPEEKHVVEHKNPGDKAQTVVVTPEVPKEKDVVISKVNLGGEEIAGAKIQINQGNKEIASWTSEAGKNHELSLLPGDYVFHEEAAPKGYVVVTDITFTVNTDGTVTVKDANGNKVVAANNQLTVTDETEYVNPTGTLRTTVKADSTIANATKAAEVTAEKAATGVEVTDTLTYEGLVPEKVYSVTGELYEVKDGQVVGTAKATATKEFTVSKEGKGEWQLAFGQVTGLEAGKTYVVYETATSKDNLVDTNKDNTPEEKHVVEHKNPGDKAQTVVVTPEVPKEKDVSKSDNYIHSSNNKNLSNSGVSLPKTGEKNSDELIFVGFIILLSISILLVFYRKKKFFR